MSNKVSPRRGNSQQHQSKHAVMRQPSFKDPFIFDNDWQNGLCSCCSDCKVCCYAYWCPCCLYLELFTDARENILTAILCPNALMNLRTKIRSTYKIEGGLCCDGLVTSLCCLCAMCQLKKELLHYGEIKN